MKNKIPFFIGALVILSILPLINLGDQSYIGHEAYYHLRAARQLPDLADDFSFSQTDIHVNPHHLLLKLGSVHLVNILLGLLSLLLFMLILEKIKFPHIDYTMILLIVSPAYIFAFSTLSTYSSAVFFILLGTYLFLLDNKFLTILSVASFVIVSMYNIFASIFVMLILYIYISFHDARKREFLITLALMAIVSISLSRPFFITYEYSVGTFVNYFSDFGSLVGFPLFLIILCIIGIFVYWNQYKNVSVLLLLVYGAGLILLYPDISIFMAFPVAAMASLGLDHIIKIKWSLVQVRNITLIIIACGLLFSTLTSLVGLLGTAPDPQMVEGLSSMPQTMGHVLSHPNNAYYIQYFSNNSAYLDPFCNGCPAAQRADSMYHGVFLDEIAWALYTNNITAIVITQDMREGLIWDKEQMLYLLKNNETFKNVFKSSTTQVYLFNFDRETINNIAIISE